MTEGTIYLLPGQGPIEFLSEHIQQSVQRLQTRPNDVDLRNFLACLDIWSDQTLLDMKMLLDRAIAARGIRNLSPKECHDSMP